MPSRWDLSAQFRDFEPVALPELQLVTDGQLQITGTLQGIKVVGTLAMKQAEISPGGIARSTEPSDENRRRFA